MWLDDDREAALEWFAHLASLCPGCGHPKAESMDPANSGRYEALADTCFACAARDGESRAASEARSSKQIGEAGLDGLYIGVRERR